MQDLHSIGAGGGSGRFFGGGGVDRRLRVYGHSLAQQALKCPRCDSLNTKFCYYNNYNLSQPRHFCKACRRYWTKGGVLRSVPVGGGCRKTKRSNSKSGASRERKSKAQSPSSTDSSSLTAVAEEGSALSAAASDSATKYGFSGAMFYDTNPPNFDDHGRQAPLMNHPTCADGRIFTEIGSFDGLMADIPTTSYDVTPRAPAADNAGPEVDEFKMQDMNSDGLMAALDWGSCGGVSGGDLSLFDLTAAFDPSYWSQPQWTGSDLSLPYLP